MRIAAVVAVVAMAALCAGVVRGQAAAQPKPLVNSDIVKLVKAGLAADTIVLTIQNKPSSFDTSPEELIRLKQQGVPQVVLNAMLNASGQVPAGPAPAQPPPQQAGQQAPSGQSPEGAWVAFYSTCPQGELVYFKATIYANNVELARMNCNTYFYTVARPGTYKFCATKGRCTTAAIGPRGAYYFRVLPTTFSYSIGQVDGSVAEAEIRDQGLSALDLSRVLAPKLVTVNPDNPPPTFLSPQ